MKAVPATASETGGARIADLARCPNCAEVLLGPKMSSYRGLGRIEHNWHCDACGTAFRTTSRLAGIVDVEEIEVPAAANG